MRYRVEVLRNGERRPAVLTADEEWSLEVADRRFTVRPREREPGDEMPGGLAGDVALRQLVEALPDDIVLLLCGTCHHFHFSGMSRQMSGGWVGYCGWAGPLPSAALTPSLDTVRILTPGCEHHTALPERPPLVPIPPGPAAPPWWQRLLAALGLFRRLRRRALWQEGESGGPCPACATPIVLAARLETDQGEVAVGRCGWGGCGAFWLLAQERKRVLAPREAEALRRWMSCPCHTADGWSE